MKINITREEIIVKEVEQIESDKLAGIVHLLVGPIVIKCPVFRNVNKEGQVFYNAMLPGERKNDKGLPYQNIHFLPDEDNLANQKVAEEVKAAVAAIYMMYVGVWDRAFEITKPENRGCDNCRWCSWVEFKFKEMDKQRRVICGVQSRTVDEKFIKEISIEKGSNTAAWNQAVAANPYQLTTDSKYSLPLDLEMKSKSSKDTFNKKAARIAKNIAEENAKYRPNIRTKQRLKRDILRNEGYLCSNHNYRAYVVTDKETKAKKWVNPPVYAQTMYFDEDDSLILPKYQFIPTGDVKKCIQFNSTEHEDTQEAMKKAGIEERMLLELVEKLNSIKEIIAAIDRSKAATEKILDDREIYLVKKRTIDHYRKK